MDGPASPDTAIAKTARLLPLTWRWGTGVSISPLNSPALNAMPNLWTRLSDRKRREQPLPPPADADAPEPEAGEDAYPASISPHAESGPQESAENALPNLAATSDDLLVLWI